MYALLRPPSPNDFDGSSSSVQDGNIWNNPYALFPSIFEMPQYLQNLLWISKIGARLVILMVYIC